MHLYGIIYMYVGVEERRGEERRGEERRGEERKHKKCYNRL
jgi:hypothetical protein